MSTYYRDYGIIFRGAVEPCSWRGVLDTTLCVKVCQWLATGWLFSPGYSGFLHHIVESGVKYHKPTIPYFQIIHNPIDRC